MNILHVAKINKNKMNGINVVVPEHILSQSKFENVAFVNLYDYQVEGLENFQIDGVNKNNFLQKCSEVFWVPDIIIFHGVNYVEHITMCKVLLDSDIPYIVVPHGGWTKQALRKKWIKKKLAYTTVFRKFVKNAVATQCLSQKELDNVEIKCANKFIGTNGRSIDASKKESFSNVGMKLLYIGRLEMNIKGLDLFVDAVLQIKGFMEDNNISVNIFGPATNIKNDNIAKYIAKKNLGKIICVNGPVIGDDKQELFESHDIFIQTSRTEGMPLGVLEAMGKGMPCVLTKGTNLADIMNDYAAGYDAGSSADSIASAITQAYNDRDNWAVKSEQSIKIICENFEWDIISQNTIEEYRKYAK